MRRLKLTARTPLEFVDIVAHLEGCQHFTYSEFLALRSQADGVAMCHLRLGNPGRPQLDTELYVSQAHMFEIARKFRYR